MNVGTLSLTGSVSSGSTLTIGNGIFSYAPTAGGSTQNLTGLTLNVGGSVINASTGSTLTLGPITRNATATVEFNSTTSGNLTTSAPNTNNILGPWASYNGGTTLAYATVTAGVIGAYTSYTGPGDKGHDLDSGQHRGDQRDRQLFTRGSDQRYRWA